VQDGGKRWIGGNLVLIGIGALNGIPREAYGRNFVPEGIFAAFRRGGKFRREVRQDGERLDSGYRTRCVGNTPEIGPRRQRYRGGAASGPYGLRAGKIPRVGYFYNIWRLGVARPPCERHAYLRSVAKGHGTGDGTLGDKQYFAHRRFTSAYGDGARLGDRTRPVLAAHRRAATAYRDGQRLVEAPAYVQRARAKVYFRLVRLYHDLRRLSGGPARLRIFAAPRYHRAF